MYRSLFVTEARLEGSNGASINSKNTFKALSSLGQCDSVAGSKFAVPGIFPHLNINYDFLWLRGLFSTLMVENLKSSFTIYDINGILHEEHKLKGGNWIECKIIAKLQKICANCANIVKVHTKNMENYFIDFGISSEFIKIPPIIDISQYSYSKKNFDFQSTVNIGYSGNSKSWQGLPTLLNAFEALEKVPDAPDLSLNLIGPSKDDLPIKTNNISFLDKCSHDVYLSTVLPKFDFFIVPRPSDIVTETTTPIKLIEAMASGVPVIASNVGGINEYVTHKEDAYLVEPNDPEALADAILFLCENPKLAQKLSKNARVNAERFFDYNVIGKKLKKLI